MTHWSLLKGLQVRNDLAGRYEVQHLTWSYHDNLHIYFSENENKLINILNDVSIDGKHNTEIVGSKYNGNSIRNLKLKTLKYPI